MARNYFGIDYGAKRIGIAVGNDQAKLASGLTALVNDATFIARLTELVIENEVTGLVLGWPRGLDGQETAQTIEVKNFADRVLAKLDLPIVYQDETMTSELVHQRSTHSKAQRRAGDVDQASAQIILQDFLDNL